MDPDLIVAFAAGFASCSALRYVRRFRYHVRSLLRMIRFR